MSNEDNKTRVAVYIRIGGDGDYTLAFEIQKRFYGKTAESRNWDIVNYYADLGADSRKQPALKTLMADCEAGRIDLVATKSSSRLSRNINSAMDVIRKLAFLKPPVGVYFEDTGMNTLERESFMFLAMLEAMAVSESERPTRCRTCNT
jgi:DNA invertase Pin-like site-specific DNA recombinase